MSRVWHTFLSHEAVKQRGPQLSAMDIQIGDEVTAWIAQENNQEPLGVEGYLIGVHLDVDHLTFDVAFPVHGAPHIYLPVRNILGRITRRNENYDGSPRGEVPLEGANDAAVPARQRPQLRVVSLNKDAHLANEEAEAQRAETAPTGIAGIDQASHE